MAALGSPLFVLAIVWIDGHPVRALRAGRLPAVVVLALLLWLGSIYLVARIIHRLLWVGR